MELSIAEHMNEMKNTLETKTLVRRKKLTITDIGISSKILSVGKKAHEDDGRLMTKNREHTRMHRALTRQVVSDGAYDDEEMRMS